MSHWIEETLEAGLRASYSLERSLNSSVTKFQHVELVRALHGRERFPALARSGHAD